MDLFNEINLVIDSFNTPAVIETYQVDDNTTQSYSFDTKKEIAIIGFMSASQFISGEVDALGLKPFYNIVNQMVDLEVRATDIDTSNIILRHTSPMYEVHALLITKELHNWMDNNNFAETLNDFGEIGVRYGNAMFKRSYQDGKLKITVPRWSSMTFDQFDIESGAIIESHRLSPIDLEKKRGTWDEEGIDLALEKLYEDYEDDDRNERSIEVLEVEIELPRNVFTQDEKTTGFSLQHYFVVPKTDKSGGIILFKEEIKSSNYLVYGRKKLDGRAWALGVVEQGKEAQREVNLLKLFERRALESGSKTIYITDDDELEDVNLLTDKENGDVIKLRGNKTLQQLQTMSNSIPLFQNTIETWKEQLKSTLSAFDSVTGDTMPSGTAYRLGLLQAKQASSIFEYLKERKGQVVKKCIAWIIEEIADDITKEHILSADFTEKEIDMMHTRFATNQANKKLAEMLESGTMPDTLTYEEMIAEYKDKLPKGKRQFLDIKKGMLKEALKFIEIHITNEADNSEQRIATLSTFLQMAQSDPNNTIFSPDAIKEIIQEIARLTNVSSLTLLSKPNTGGQVQLPQVNAQSFGVNQDGANQEFSQQPANV